MRLTITLRGTDGTVILPLHYQQYLQGLIYHSLSDEAFAHFLHDRGFRKEKRSFKMFTFSRLFGEHYIQYDAKTITFVDSIQWHIGTVLPELTQQLGEYLLLQPYVKIGDQHVIVERVETEKRAIEQREIEIDMLSPMTVYSTYETVDGKKKTQFFDPNDEVFPHLMERNFHNKYEAYYGVPPSDRLLIEPVDVRKNDRIVTSFKGFYITAWKGRYKLISSPENLTFLYRVGIGGRNSQGFGMFRIANRK
ncbi:CRISPR-associated endoribonuclease Cas6 [Anoxybacillus tengchongensis]|uniref:CRISPR-associated endoribonuclease n=1 Tax=Anoxybacillus tengchongensis TaxID=576944 RepID=A0A7W9YQ50_9BACL|nr:CRISPR-associated endoribonuclease Cas6 [Anoxybacillus tengchongensis]MBB6175211.1 CRISPR-associated endoribonuclease Cas6 [Anoxybacillus tengchongensis]